MDFLNVWFPAHCHQLCCVSYMNEKSSTVVSTGCFDDPAMASDTSKLTAQKRMRSRAESCISTLVRWMRKRTSPHSLASSKLIGLTCRQMTSCSSLPLLRKEFFMECLNKKQLVRGLGRAEKAQVTILLPGSCSLSEWSEKVRCMPHSWPKSFNIGKMQMDKPTPFTCTGRARHMWLSLKPDCHLLTTHVYTECGSWPCIGPSVLKKLQSAHVERIGKKSDGFWNRSVLPMSLWSPPMVPRCGLEAVSVSQNHSR